MNEHIGEAAGAGIGILHAVFIEPYANIAATVVSTASLAFLGGAAGAVGQYLFRKLVEKYHEKH